MFDVIVHADWSVRPHGRQVATASRHGAGWRVTAPAPVGDLDGFRKDLLERSRQTPVLAGFDFPIGLPAAYGVQTGFDDFPEALQAFGTADGWEDFYRIAAAPDEIAIRRPFFPAGSGAGTRLSWLAEGLGLTSTEALLRACERSAPGRKRASPPFWTVGAAQVGRAAMIGWRHVVAPALRAGAALWPFDGGLPALAQRGGLVIAETYPADAYAHIGAPFGPRESKRRQADRRGKAAAIRRWAAGAQVDLTACAAELDDGFGSRRNGEDAFDALMGLLATIAVVDGHHPAIGVALPPEQARWEGWILGR